VQFLVLAYRPMIKNECIYFGRYIRRNFLVPAVFYDFKDGFVYPYEAGSKDYFYTKVFGALSVFAGNGFIPIYYITIITSRGGLSISEIQNGPYYFLPILLSIALLIFNRIQFTIYTRSLKDIVAYYVKGQLVLYLQTFYTRNEVLLVLLWLLGYNYIVGRPLLLLLIGFALTLNSAYMSISYFVKYYQLSKSILYRYLGITIILQLICFFVMLLMTELSVYIVGV
jgi:hypothetical protein